MPGDTLPLKVVRSQDRAKLETALHAPAPYTRLIAVVSWFCCCLATRLAYILHEMQVTETNKTAA